MAGPETEIVQRLSPEQQQQGLRVLAELRRLHARPCAPKPAPSP
jgi:hypothetical protein